MNSCQNGGLMKSTFSEKELQQADEVIRRMTPLDAFLFREMMNVQEIHDSVVDICMQEHVVFADKPQAEKVFHAVPEKRGIRVDVYNESVDKRIYTIEMQGKNTGNIPRRSRFYQAQIDVHQLEPGERDFNRLLDINQIMICPFDLFGKNACRYTFQEMCVEYPNLKLKDGGHRIFINTKGKNREEFTEEFVEFLDYINAPAEEAEKYTTTEKMKKLHAGIMGLKQKKGMNREYMSYWEEIEDYKEEAWEKGLAEGRAEGRAVQIVEMGLEFGLSVNEILTRLQAKLNISQRQAEEYFIMYGGKQM